MVASSINPEPAMSTQPAALDTYLQRLPMIRDKSAGSRFGRTQCARRGRAMDGEHHKIEVLRQLAMTISVTTPTPSEVEKMDALLKLSPAQNLLLHTAACRARPACN